MTPGSLMKALIRPGAGEKKPTDGDQVIYHCTIRTLDGVVVESTRAEFGGFREKQDDWGLLEGIPTMLNGEVAMFKVKPELHYGEEDCPVSVADTFPKDDELHFEIELIDFSKVKARMLDLFLTQCISVNMWFINFQVISEDLGIIKKVKEEGQGWEQPREPYEVKAWISGKSADGKVIFSHTQGEPFFFTFGKSEIPKGLEMGIGTMARGEKAVIYVTKEYLSQCSLIPSIEGIAEIHFDVELVHFVQVRDVLGDGRLIKRRLRDGRGEFPMDCPLHDSLLHVHYKGMLLNEEKTVFYDTRVDNNGQPLEFRSGEGLVPEGFEMCTRLMLPGEIALVTCPPDYAYDKFPRPDRVPQGAHIQWEIELLDYEKQKIAFSFVLLAPDNDLGNRLFKEGKYELAKAKYEHVLREFNHVNPQNDEEGKEFSDTRVLDANPVHVKALYRRGMAYMGDGILKKLEQISIRRARQQFKGLFDKKPGEIAEAGGLDLGEKETDESHDRDALDGEKEHLLEATAPPPARTSLWSRLWPSGRRLFTSLGLDRCTIL
ncbi:UNVERIFIED_CONTAM: Peptidyl-prolyl cis-trans isomerase PASTICCINO1 [Sesamum radiatum]|uniref:peptidylprolyl isomerase n=1 Tax=Sesamum radiatum TaxID=300843 RepID=A0AAW2R5R9_SESRA